MRAGENPAAHLHGAKICMRMGASCFSAEALLREAWCDLAPMPGARDTGSNGQGGPLMEPAFIFIGMTAPTSY